MQFVKNTYIIHRISTYSDSVVIGITSVVSSAESDDCMSSVFISVKHLVVLTCVHCRLSMIQSVSVLKIRIVTVIRLKHYKLFYKKLKIDPRNIFKD